MAGVVLTLLGFWAYNAKDGKINTATWLMWVVGDGLEAVSYFVMTGEDFVKNAVPITFAIGSFITFVVALSRRRFGMPDGVDWTVIVADLVITAGWFQRYLNAATANIMFVFTEVVSFFPLYRGVLAGREREYVMPWILWAAGDAFFLATVMSLSHTTEEKIYPIAQMVAHFIVVVCILNKKAGERVPR